MAYGSYYPLSANSSLDNTLAQSRQPASYMDLGSQMQMPSYQAPDSGASSQMGGLSNQMGDTAISASGGNPYAIGGGLALKAIGTGLDIYGKYQARDEAQQRYEAALAEWKRQQRQEDEDRSREMRRQERSEAAFAGDYSMGLEDRFAGAYGGYRQPGGR